MDVMLLGWQMSSHALKTQWQIQLIEVAWLCCFAGWYTLFQAHQM